MKKDLCADCVWNAVSPEYPERRGCACLFACAEVTKISGDPCITLACGDYVLGDPLPIDIGPERLDRIYYQLFPERRVKKGESYAVPENEKPRRIYRVTFYTGQKQRYVVDVGAVKASEAVICAKTAWSEQGRFERMRQVEAKRVNAVKYCEFTPYQDADIADVARLEIQI